jgi:hypothetical protein
MLTHQRVASIPGLPAHALTVAAEYSNGAAVRQDRDPGLGGTRSRS